jgi:methionyl-tRNA formyltransferase
MNVILAGKHDLAVKIFDLLFEMPGINLGVLTCKSEVIDNQRANLKARLDKCNVSPLNHDYSHDTILKVIHDIKPDLFLSAGFDKIIKVESIHACPNIINIHFGMLPKYRGSYSIPWAIINNEEYIGITLHEIHKGIDDGPIIDQTTIYNDHKKAAVDLYKLAVEGGISLVKIFVQRLQNKEELTKIPQDNFSASYYPPIYPNNYCISWNRTVTFVYNYIRASYFPPYFPAFFVVGDLKVGIVFPVDYEEVDHHFAIGKIIQYKDVYCITALNGFIKPSKVKIDDLWLDFKSLVEKEELLNKIIP